MLPYLFKLGQHSATKIFSFFDKYICGETLPLSCSFIYLFCCYNRIYLFNAAKILSQQIYLWGLCEETLRRWPWADQVGGSKGSFIVAAFISFIIIVIGKGRGGVYFGEGGLEEFWWVGIIDQTFATWNWWKRQMINHDSAQHRKENWKLIEKSLVKQSNYQIKCSTRGHAV